MVGVIREGRVDMEAGMSIAETAPDGTNPGGMAGGDTVPDDDKEPKGISPNYKGEDPEDLDLNVDVNEEYGAPLDYDDDEELDEYGSARMPMDYAGMGEADDEDDDMYGDDADDMEEMGGDMEYADDEYGDYEENIMGYSESRRGGNVFEKMKNRAAEKAVFAKHLSKHKAPEGSKGNNLKSKKGKRGATKFLTKYGKKEGVKISGGVHQPDRTATKAGAKKRADLRKARTKKKAQNSSREYSIPFSRRLQENGATIGAVRVHFSESGAPTGYEFYDEEGILETVTDAFGDVIHQVIDESRNVGEFGPELWETEDGTRYRPERIIRMAERSMDMQNVIDAQKAAKAKLDKAKKAKKDKKDKKDEAWMREDEFARHGGDSGIVSKGNAHQGKSGGEYSKRTAFQNKQSSGDIGTAGTPGDYDDASEEGDGEHVEKGTWPGSGGTSEGYDGEYVAHLREKVAYLEEELARYEDLSQGQHETISALREAARQSELQRARAEAFETHPELRVAERRLMACESVADLNDEIGAMLSLVETVRPDAPPAPLLETVSVSHSGSPRDGVPGALNESSSPHSDRLGAGIRLGSGDVASRVAAHRKRRRG